MMMPKKKVRMRQYLRPCVVLSALFACATVVLTVTFSLQAGAAEGESVARCFRIDPVNGDDANNGSLEHPWRSFANVISYYKSEYRPAGWVELKPGDCVYLMDGVHSRIVHPGDGTNGPDGGGSFIAYFRGRRSDTAERFQIRAYPGHKPIIDPQGKGIGVSIFQSSHWDVAGIEIRNAYQRGVSLTESDDLTLRDVHIHDTDGVDNNNIAGLYITDCRNVEVRDCVFNDNYDRTCADTNGRSTENSCNVVIFGGMQGGDITITDCYIHNARVAFHKDEFTIRAGGGVKYKHASRVPQSVFHVHHNLFQNLSFFAFGSGTANTHFHDNVIIGPAGISSRDFGGVTHQVNQIFENNLLYRAWGLALNPTIHWRNDQFPDDPKNIVFRNNVVYDTAETWSQERGIVMIGTYMSDELCDAAADQLHFEANAYYHPDRPVQLNFAAGFNDRQGYARGDVYGLKRWQEELGYDRTSSEADRLELDFRYTHGFNWTLLEPVYGQNNKLEIELLVKAGHYPQALKMLKRLPAENDLYRCMCDDAPHQHRSAWRKMLIVRCLPELDREDEARKELKSIFESKAEPAFVIPDVANELLIQLETANGYEAFERWLAEHAPSIRDFSLASTTALKKQIENANFTDVIPTLSSIDYHHRFDRPIELRWHQRIVIDALRHTKDEGSLDYLLAELLDEELVRLATHSDVCPSGGIPFAIGEIGDSRAVEALQKAQKAFLHTNTKFEINVLFARAKCGDTTAAAELYKNRIGNLLHKRHLNMLLERATGVSFGRIKTAEDADAIFEKWRQHVGAAEVTSSPTTAPDP